MPSPPLRPGSGGDCQQRRCPGGGVRGPFPSKAGRGAQYHPEVIHSPHGQQILSRFLHDFAGIGATWTPTNIADSLIEAVREQIGDGYAICGLAWSGPAARHPRSGPLATG